MSKEFARRRAELLKKIPEGAIVILSAGKQTLRSHDTHYVFRPDSDFYYLTGFAEPEAYAVLFLEGRKTKFILFNQPNDPEKAIWDGVREGQEGACKKYGADLSYPYTEFESKLAELLIGHKSLYYPLGCFQELDTLVLKTMSHIKSVKRKGVHYPKALVNLETVLHSMRQIKSPAEIQLMRKAAEISAKAHIKAMELCSPGMNEYELEAAVRYEMIRHGAKEVAYNSIVAGGRNACILHYEHNNALLNGGELVLIDAGAEYQYYAADITRTFPVNGKFNQEQAAIYNLVLKTQENIIKMIKPGVRFNQLQEKATKLLHEGLINLGLLKGPSKKLWEKADYRRFYMHGVSHWLGMDVHDVGSYQENGKWQVLEPGMVLTVEPGIYITEDPSLEKRWWNIGVRIEDDILVTDAGHENLSKHAPKTIKEIEMLMAEKKHAVPKL